MTACYNLCSLQFGMSCCVHGHVSALYFYACGHVAPSLLSVMCVWCSVT